MLLYGNKTVFSASGGLAVGLVRHRFSKKAEKHNEEKFFVLAFSQLRAAYDGIFLTEKGFGIFRQEFLAKFYTLWYDNEVEIEQDGKFFRLGTLSRPPFLKNH